MTGWAAEGQEDYALKDSCARDGGLWIYYSMDAATMCVCVCV